VTVLIFQTIALHVADEGDTEPGRVLAVVGAFRTDPRACTARLGEQFRHQAFEDAVVIDDQPVKPGSPFSIFCHRPAAEGSAAAGQAAAAQRVRPTISDSNRRSPKDKFRIVVTSTNPSNSMTAFNC